MRETRAHALYAHVAMAVRHTGGKEHDFADEVVALYHQRTPLHARAIDFKLHAIGADTLEVMRANAQLLFRMLKPDGPVRMPVELEEAVILALPQPYQDACQRELAERLGCLAAALPPAADAPLALQIKTPCDLLRRAAEAVERIAPMLVDGSIGPEDAEYFGAALTALADVQGVCITMNAQIGQAMQTLPGAKVLPLRKGGGW